MFPWKRDRDTIKNPVDVSFILDESREADGEQFEVTPVEEINVGWLLDKEYGSNDRDVVPPSSLPNRRGRVKFGFTEQIADGKSNFSMRVVLKGATAAPARPIESDLTQSDMDLIGVVVGDEHDSDDDSSVHSDLSNVSNTTQVLPPAAPIDGRPIRIFDEVDLERADESYDLRRKLSLEVYEKDVNHGDDDSFEVSTLADLNVYTDTEKMDMMKENCVHFVAPSAAVLTATTCAAAVAMALL